MALRDKLNIKPFLNSFRPAKKESINDVPEITFNVVEVDYNNNTIEFKEFQQTEDTGYIPSPDETPIIFKNIPKIGSKYRFFHKRLCREITQGIIKEAKKGNKKEVKKANIELKKLGYSFEITEVLTKPDFRLNASAPEVVRVLNMGILKKLLTGVKDDDNTIFYMMLINIAILLYVLFKIGQIGG